MKGIEMLTDEYGMPLSSTQNPTPDQIKRSKLLTSQCFDESKYEYDFSYKPADPTQHYEARSTMEMLSCLEANPSIELDARILGISQDGLKSRRYDAQNFKEAFDQGSQKDFNFRELDVFARSDFNSEFGGGFLGQDFTPLLGGPFYKNLYYYQDYIRMHSECFYAYHYDPIAKAIVSITRDFVIGKGFEVECDTSDRNGKLAMATWKSFEEVNDLQKQIEDCCTELSIYGENLFWWLPNNQTKIVYQLNAGDKVPVGIIPRVRLLDPSNMIEIITYPEDITRKLFYVWLTPTQYQIYTTSTPNPTNPLSGVQPTLKFIYQQIPADQILHFAINKVSNEKRGRSDLFPVLSYLKRLRDSVNYSLVALQKVSAWSMDTTIEGNQADIDAYVQNQAALGTIPFAGSEFVHSKAISRQYLGNSNVGGGMSDAFLYCLSLICAGTQIPFNYLGTHLSSGTTRASALVATEPVAKKMEMRREVIKRVIKNLWSRLMKEAGIPIMDCNVIFPEIITQDRSQKLQDLAMGQQQGWWSEERAAKMAAKELGITDYDYNSEKEKASTNAAPDPENSSPLTSQPKVPPLPSLPKPGQMNSQDKKEIKTNDRNQ